MRRDATIITRDGEPVLVEIIDDWFTGLDDFEPTAFCDRDIAAYHAGEWRFVYLAVTPLVNGQPDESRIWETRRAIPFGEGATFIVTTADLVRDEIRRRPRRLILDIPGKGACK